MKPGRVKKRSELKELLLLLLLKLEGPLGRYRLKGMLDLAEHEGVVRLMLSDLCKSGYVKAVRTGCAITAKGLKALDKSLQKYSINTVRPLDLTSFHIEPSNMGVLISSKANLVMNGMEQRDASVRAGARGAIVFTVKGKKLVIPPSYTDFAQQYPDLAKKIHEAFHPIEGDVLIVGFAATPWKALEGALAATLALR